MLIQVMGQNGMLGRAVVKAIARRGHDLHPNQCDITIVTPGHIHAPVVINCAGLVKQIKHPDHMFILVNAYAPHLLAWACATVDARLIHVSTDCVFSQPYFNSPPGPYMENSRPDAAGIYARSKLAGEIVDSKHLTVRTSFVGFGPRGLIHDLQGNQEVNASDRLLWSGHTVDAVADALVSLAERADVTGLLHIPGEFQSRLELCERLKARFDLPAPIVRDDWFVADRRLISPRWAALKLPSLPPFDQQLETMEVVT